MPRDLEALTSEDTVQGLPELSKSPEEMVDRKGLTEAEDERSMLNALSQRNEKRDELHPYTQSLTLSDIESCVRLEEATFPENERCTREKFQYRLKRCGELSMGIYTSHETNDIITAETSTPVYSGAPERKAVLLGHIVATKTTNSTVKDSDMSIPDSPDSKVGHTDEGRTICIHSLAVLPQYQKRGLGKTLLKAYLQRMEGQGVGDRVALIAHEHLIAYYEGFGFENKGKSEAQFGGGGWYDLVRELRSEESADDDDDDADGDD
ncbi:hypothetical protein LTR37_021044 [Vermiconidia calcicola]|uniref:Uncharacterized protein n=1 Tax=Vermiconidia calcicola TaxID=1690605 RepID=A0ACC3MBE7_9PEZI|nr:hypothetical protein LTR37_021044 [Vermiconidia calcicola]